MTHYLITLCAFLLLKSIGIGLFILYGNIGLGPDEAQYWTWSQLLDWGYYSKPPAIAWEIWFGTQLFGNTELGVRFGAIIIGFLIPIVVYFLAKACNLKDSTAFWAGIAMAFSPLGFLASFLATTDGGMVLFWTLACLVVCRSTPPNYVLLGVVIMCGALFKWPIYSFWVLVLLLTPFDKRIFLGIAISLLGLLPSFLWNSTHDWVTFRHVLATIIGGSEQQITNPPKANFFEFLGAQAALLSPILFILLIISFFKLRNWKNIPHSIRFCGLSCLLTLLFYIIFSMFQKMQGNWGVYAYPAGIVFLSWAMLEETQWGKLWVKIGVYTSILLTVFALSIPYLQEHSLVSLPYKSNPFKHNLGWKELSNQLAAAGYDPQHDFLFGDKYQTTSLLSFYSPEQKRAYFLNLHGIRKNQFSYWPRMPQEQKGKTGYFVLPENSPHLEKDEQQRIDHYQDILSHYFSRVEFLGIKPLFTIGNKVVKGAFIFKGIDYNGQEPVDPELY